MGREQDGGCQYDEVDDWYLSREQVRETNNGCQTLVFNIQREQVVEDWGQIVMVA